VNAAAVVAGIALLYVGAEGLVRGSAVLALRLGVSRLVIGLTVVAIGTSSPELLVTLEAAIFGEGDIAVGSVVGSNISNIGLILGSAALFSPLLARKPLLRIDLPIMIFCSILLTLLLADSRLERWEGLLLTAGALAYGAWLWRRSRAEGAGPVTGLPGVALHRIWAAAAMSLGGLALLVVGADWLVLGSVGVARAIGVSEAIMGLTLVALGTSLPEFATSVVAGIKGESDIAVGNIVGANVFNILAIVGPAAVVSPLHSPGVRLSDLAIMTSLAVIALILLSVGKKLGRRDGSLLLLLYAAYVLHLLSRA
jgi:cation:H+ antiporter